MVARTSKLADGHHLGDIVGTGSHVQSPPEPVEPPRKRARIKIGGFYVTGDKASAAQVKQFTSKSTAMLERLGHKIARPGVRLQAARNIPLFSADPQHPDRFLRDLDGRTESGVLENGVFKVMD